MGLCDQGPGRVSLPGSRGDLRGGRRLLRSTGSYPRSPRGNRDRRVQPDRDTRRDDARRDEEPRCGRGHGGARVVNYRLAYAVGFHPWEDLVEHPPFAEKLMELVAREELDGPPYGPALDIGTGSGVWGVRLAERGWQVTGVDIVERALDRARGRVEETGVEMRLMPADV